MVGSMRNGSQVLLAGNPLHCGCNARPLKYFMLQQTIAGEDLQSIYCATPALIKDKQLISLDDDYLHCAEDEQEMYKGIDYEQLTDVRFREVKTNQAGLLTLSWYVSGFSDVADFHVYIRSSSNDVLYQSDYAYNDRTAQIPVEELSALGEEKLRGAEICIVSRDSDGNTRKWFSGQCQQLPSLKRPRTFFFGNFQVRGGVSRTSSSLPHCLLYIILVLFVARL